MFLYSELGRSRRIGKSVIRSIVLGVDRGGQEHDGGHMHHGGLSLLDLLRVYERFKVTVSHYR